MGAIVDTHEQAAALELEPLLVRRPLEAFLDRHGLGAGEPVEAQPVGEGHSNVTYLIARGEQSWVLRRPPRGPLPPSAHDVLREAFLLERTHGRMRTPRVLATCDDPAVIGAPFYVMERVDGDVITSAVPAPLDTPEGRRAIAAELIDTLVEIHAVDWRAAGLEGYGKPTGYLDRQLRRFGGLWEHNKTREVPALDAVTRWLLEHKPESGAATIVHGDYRLGNVMYAPGTPARLVAVFDWELATIGDPLADLGYLTAMWAEPGDPEGTITSLGSVTRQPGFPARDELVARYEQRSGRSMSEVHWYRALALWKSAVFLEGSYKRLLAGTTDDPFFRLLDAGVPEIAEMALATARAGAA